MLFVSWLIFINIPYATDADHVIYIGTLAPIMLANMAPYLTPSNFQSCIYYPQHNDSMLQAPTQQNTAFKDISMWQ